MDSKIIIVLFWLVFLAPSFARLFVIKNWEIQQAAGRDWKVQLIALHPAGEMADLLQVRQQVEVMAKKQDCQVQVLAPSRNELLPLANDASILRAVFYPWPVKLFDRIEPGEHPVNEKKCWLSILPAKNLKDEHKLKETVPAKKLHCEEKLCWQVW